MHLEHEIRRMAGSISGLPRHDSDGLTFADLREAIDAVPPEDAVEWLGMCEILAAEEKRKGVVNRDGFPLRYESLPGNRVADLTPGDPWTMYMLLTRGEAAFRHLKTDLSIRPIHHRKENRGDAQVLFAVLAKALSITIQLRYRQHGGDLTTPALLETLQGVQLAERSYYLGTKEDHEVKT